jgi:hypothetical protein
MPKSIARELAHPEAQGSRHAQMTHLIKALISLDWSAEKIFKQFRVMYEADLPDREIHSIIRWGQKLSPTPYCNSAKGNYPMFYTYTAPCLSPSEIARKTSVQQAIANALDYLDGFEISEGDLHDASIIRLSSDFRKDAALVFESLYQPDEFVCVNASYQIVTQSDGSTKTTIVGPGVTFSARGWLDKLSAPNRSAKPTPAGVWIRMNPVTEPGSGAAGTHTDADVTHYRFVLVEFDSIPLDIQLALLCSLYHAVAMICSSGGKSYHAWVLVRCADAESYKATVDSIYSHLAKFKVDTANGNASRYSRLPGVTRENRCGWRRPATDHLPEPERITCASDFMIGDFEPFPAHALAPVQRDLGKAVARVLSIEPEIPYCCTLSATSAACGRSLMTPSGPNRKIGANTYFLIGAVSGLGKSSLFRPCFEPLHSFQQSRINRFIQIDRPRLRLEEAKLKKEFEIYKKSIGKKNFIAGQDDKMKQILARLAELEIELRPPQVVCEDTTSEALVLVLQSNREQIFSLSADADKVFRNIEGRYVSGKTLDESLYVKPVFYS